MGLKDRAPHVDILEVHLDVTDEDAVSSAVDQIISKFGRIDIAVNNAGIGGGPFNGADLPKSDFEKVLAVNLIGVMTCQSAELRAMIKQEPLHEGRRYARGVIINVSSMYGLVGASANTPATAYAAAKHGVMGLTKTDAIVYAEQRIRINAINPGYVATPLLGDTGDESSQGVWAREMVKTPMRRLAQPAEIADCICFLGSRMSSYMTGAGLVVDGGFSAM